MDVIMEATATARGPSEVHNIDLSDSYATPSPQFSHGSTAEHIGDPEQVCDDRDFDTFVEEQLRDGTGSLYADAMTWMERRLLVRVLALTNGNKSKACQILGITRGSLRHKICQLGIAIHQTVRVHELNGR
jgi:DNA-binding protein Fis